MKTKILVSILALTCLFTNTVTFQTLLSEDSSAQVIVKEDKFIMTEEYKQFLLETLREDLKKYILATPTPITAPTATPTPTPTINPYFKVVYPTTKPSFWLETFVYDNITESYDMRAQAVKPATFIFDAKNTIIKFNEDGTLSVIVKNHD